MRRRAGWLPERQEDLEAWLVGHRERVQARGERVGLHPVLTEFQDLMAGDAVVRMYVERMIAQVPAGKPYSTRHVRDVPQLLRRSTRCSRWRPSSVRTRW